MQCDRRVSTGSNGNGAKHVPATPECAPQPAFRSHPSKLFVEVTTRCNLRCSMCVKEANGQRIAEGDLSLETFARLAPALPQLDTLILNGIGEPLLHPQLERFIADAKRVMPASGHVGFQSNGQLLDRKRAFSLAEAGVDRICISADAVSADIFGLLRRGGRPEMIETAAVALHEAGAGRGRAISLGVEFVAMRDNLHQLPEIVRWAARNRFSFVIVTHMVAYNPDMAGSAAFVAVTDLSQQVHREFRERAAADGVDLNQLLSLFMHVGPGEPADYHRAAYISKMVAHASQQDVCLNHTRLLQWDEAPVRQTSEWFEAAEEIARQEGIDLRLPATVPTRARRCDFVEDGSCFVSWEGDVHPCYFLWHRYSCHIGGYAKQVQPLSFGNLAKEDVLDIWNGPAARAFRGEVLKYDYPFCYDCNVALCNYVDNEEFSSDCYMSSVPCGACLWPTGVFHCLK
jgi:putative metalloenzyme radical SAM/SPASM domain maturase